MIVGVVVLCLLGLLFLSGLIYSTVGRLDEVVTTHATVVPRGLVRPVQAATGGRVTRVAVQEGELVARDQAIVLAVFRPVSSAPARPGP